MPLLDKQLLPQQIEVWIWHTTESEEELQSLFAPNSCPPIPAFRVNARRRLDFLASRLLLQQRLSYLPEVAYSESGRPYLPDEGCEIAISHTGAYVAVAFHPHQAIGVDIEGFSSRALRVSARFIREDERVLIADDEPERAATLVWSAKEALFKAIACTEVDFRQHMQLLTYSAEASGTLAMQEHKTPACRRYALYYRTYPTFILTAAIAL